LGLRVKYMMLKNIYPKDNMATPNNGSMVSEAM
jgi:hypothetical protein